MERPSESSMAAQPILVTEETLGFQLPNTCPTCGGEMQWCGDAGSFDEDCRCLDFIVWCCVQCGDYICVDPCRSKINPHSVKRECRCDPGASVQAPGSHLFNFGSEKILT